MGAMSPDQITRNAAAIAGAVKMLEREIASCQTQLSVSASIDETRRQISDFLTELHLAHDRASLAPLRWALA
jgi:hypothetical protein